MNNDSPWTGPHESPLDRAIDRAVREMMHVDPPPGLRRRVLSRLETPVAKRRLFVPRYAWGAAALVILIVAVMFTRDDRSEPVTVVPQPPVAARESTPPLEPSAAPPRAPVPAPRPTASRVPSPLVTRDPIPMPRITNVFGTRTAGVSAAAESGVEAVWPGADPPSNAVAPLVIAPLTPVPIDTPAIVIPPLVIAAPKGGL
jgi:hypothetical protein